MLKLILSTDGKHSVWVETDKVKNHQELDAVYDNAKYLYEKIVKDLGTKAEMWGEIMNGNNKKPKANGPVCPKCGAVMIKRKGDKGLFYGCSNYPNCKGTRPVNVA